MLDAGDTLSLNEGAKTEVEIRMEPAPVDTATVSIALSPADALSMSGEGYDEGALTFDAEHATRTLTVTALNDQKMADGSVTVGLRLPGATEDSAKLAVTIANTEKQSLQINAGAAGPYSLAIGEGGSGAEFQVGLAIIPAVETVVTVTPTAVANAAIKLNDADADQAVTLRFAPGATAPQHVAVTAVADADTDGGEVKLTVASADLESVDVTAKITDGTQTLTLSRTTVEVTEGVTPATFTVQPRVAGTVTITRAATDPVTLSGPADLAEAAGVLTLTFTGEHPAAQQVIVTPATGTNMADVNFQLTVATDGVTPSPEVAVRYTAQQAVLIYDAETGGNLIASGAVGIDLTEGAPSDEIPNLWVRLKKAPAETKTLLVDPGSKDHLSPSNDEWNWIDRLSFTPTNYSTRQRLIIVPVSDDGNTENDEATLTISDPGSTGAEKAADWTRGYTLTDRGISMSYAVSGNTSATSISLVRHTGTQQICFTRTGGTAAARVVVAAPVTAAEVNGVSLSATVFAANSGEACGTLSATTTGAGETIVFLYQEGSGENYTTYATTNQLVITVTP